MRGKPNLDSFISGGAADAAETKTEAKSAKPAKASVPKSEEARTSIDALYAEAKRLSDAVTDRTTKSIRIKRSLDVRLKEEAYRRTLSGKRTSESDVIEDALNKYFNI
jgi:hypothetical protein